MIFALTSRRPRSVRGAGVGRGIVLKLNEVDDDGGVADVVSVADVILDLQSFIYEVNKDHLVRNLPYVCF